MRYRSQVDRWRVRSRWRRVGIVTALGLLATSLGWLVAPADDSAAQVADVLTLGLTVSQTTDLVNGHIIDIEVTPPAGYKISTGGVGGIWVCREHAVFTGARQPSFTDTGPHNCAPNQFKDFSPEAPRSAQQELYPMPDGSGARGVMAIGHGTIEPLPGQNAEPLTCGPDNPCQLFVYAPVVLDGQPLFIPDSNRYGIASVPLTYSAGDDPVAQACGVGSAAGAIAAVGPDRMLQTHTEWVVSQCRTTGSQRTATNLSPGAEQVGDKTLSGEQLAFTKFASGERDLAYSAVSPTTPGFEPPIGRSAVPVPVALNAMVVGVLGGYNTQFQDLDWPYYLKRPYSPARLTAELLAELLGQSAIYGFQPGNPTGSYEELTALNPEFARGGSSGHVYDGSYPLANILGASDAGTLFLTAYLQSLAPDRWVAPAAVGSGPYGVLSKAAQSLNSNVAAVVSNRAVFERVVAGVTAETTKYGPAWIVTDYATALQLGITPVALEGANGELVAPTPESIAAGLASMTAQPDGTLVPDPTKLVPGAYPLTMVEYAWAPTEPLVDAACAPRQQSQQILTDWLQFITGPGQESLAEGLVPLSAELVSQANEATASVGTAPSTAVCAGPGGSLPGSPGTFPSPGFPGSTPTGAGTEGSGGRLGDLGSDLASGAFVEATPESIGEAAEAADEAEVESPPFLGSAALSEVVPPLSILLVVALTSLTAMATSGRPLPAPVAQLPGRVGRRLRPVSRVRRVLPGRLGRR